MKNHNKPSHLHRGRSNGRIRLRHKLQLAQHAGMRTKEPVKVTLVPAPWDDEEQKEKNDGRK